MRALMLGLALGACGCGRGAPAPESRADGGASMLTPQRTIIGTARMREDGTIVLDLRHPWMHQEYPPGHPRHASIVEHVGGLRPGEEKAVPPWPDDIDDAAVEAAVRAHLPLQGLSPDTCTATIEGTDREGNVVVTVLCGGRRLSLKLRAGTYEVLGPTP